MCSTVAVSTQLADDERHLARKHAMVPELHFRSVRDVTFGLHHEQVLQETRRQLFTQPEKYDITAVQQVGA
jgi:hypothetical protein